MGPNDTRRRAQDGHPSGARTLARTLARTVAMPVACVAALALSLVAACTRETPIEVYVDGFEPENVRFEVEDLGAREQAELTEIARRGDIDGLLLLPAGACGGPCRATIVSIFVHNRGDAEAPPVVRLKVPGGKPTRQPIAFRGGEISHGRIGRIRWIVELWPEEKHLTATVSSSVFLVDPAAPPATAPPATAPPATAPPATAPPLDAPPPRSPAR